MSLAAMRRSRPSRSVGRISSPSDGSVTSPVDLRPGSSWKTRDDDIASAMAAVQRCMKVKTSCAHLEPNRHTASTPSLHFSHQRDTSDWVDLEDAIVNPEDMPCVRALRTAMKGKNLAALRRSIEDAATSGAPESILGEARALYKLETSLQTAMAEANLNNIRNAVAEVERGKALAAFPRDPPFVLDQQLQYWSERRGAWVPCHVVATSVDNRIRINLKKKADHWYSLHEQHEKFQVLDANVATAAPHVHLVDARALLDKADALEAALLSENVAKIEAAAERAKQEVALKVLVNRAETFVHEALRRRNTDRIGSALVSSNHALAWLAAKRSIQHALRAEADRAWKNTAGKASCTSLENLEWDLAIERLKALEESFDSTDLGALEMSIDKLASGDLEVPEIVVDEARQALSSLAEQHEKLQKAIQDGDVENVRAAIELAKEHFLPEALVCKARSTVEIADALDRAIKNQDPRVLTSILAQAEKEGSTVLAQRARSIAQSTELLQAALRSNDIDAIEKAMSGVDVLNGPPALLEQARQLLAQQQAQKQREEEIRQKRERLLAVVRDGNLEEIREAIEESEAHGFLETPLCKARAKLEMATALDEAIKSQDPEMLSRALTWAARDGAQMHLVEQAKAASALQKIMQGESTDGLEEALRAAEAAGVPKESLAKAREQVESEKQKREAVHKRARFLENLTAIASCHETLTIRAAIAEGEALGFVAELEILRQALEDELEQMKARAMGHRKEQEKLAGEFRSAKEAQDLGGAILVAQWRAAVAEVAKPFVFSEEEERERERQIQAK